MLNLKRQREPLLPTGVLKALAASNLPNSVSAYNARLTQLQVPSS
jgi:hypothetical protein